MLAFDGNKKVLDANGQVIFDSQAIVIEVRLSALHSLPAPPLPPPSSLTRSRPCNRRPAS